MWLVTRALNECNKGSQRILGRVLNSVFNVKAVIAAFNQEKALVGAFSVITNLWMELFQALIATLPTNLSSSTHVFSSGFFTCPLSHVCYCY